MPRNRYTRRVHEEESVQIASREQELLRIARKLRRPDTKLLVMPSDNEAKAHRQHRLVRKQRDKAGQVQPARASQS
jgi:hypothetical protein